MEQNLQKIAPSLESLLSDLGKRIFLPEGIVMQSALAKNQAKKINATVGIATTGKEPLYLEGIKKYFPNHNPKNIFPYAPTLGIKELQNLWKKKIYKDNPNLKKKIYGPVVLQGLTHSTSLLAQLFINPNDAVVLSDFCWENYEFIFKTRFGAKVNYYSFYNEEQFSYQGLNEAISKEQKEKVIVVLNFPHNPTGYQLTLPEVEKITELLLEQAKKGKKLLVVCDDSYFGLNYEKNLYQESLFAKVAHLHPNIVAAKIDGITKELYTWGFRLGFLSLAFACEDETVAYKILDKKMQGLVRAEVSSMSHPLQTLLSDYLKNVDLEKEQAPNIAILKNRYYKLKKLLKKEKYKSAYSYYPFNSGYFFCLKIKKVSAKKLWKLLLEKYQVGVIYLNEESLRIAYSSVAEENLEDLLENIYQAHQELLTN